MSKPVNTPDRAQVLRIITEEACRMNVDPTDVINRSNKREAVTARQLAIIRIREETGCSQRGLSYVWGISDATVRAAYNPPPARPEAKPQPLDATTLARLTWQYGVDRAAAIAGGRDLRTQEDLAAWRSLGRRPAA